MSAAVFAFALVLLIVVWVDLALIYRSIRRRRIQQQKWRTFARLARTAYLQRKGRERAA